MRLWVTREETAEWKYDNNCQWWGLDIADYQARIYEHGGTEKFWRIQIAGIPHETRMYGFSIEAAQAVAELLIRSDHEEKVNANG